MKYHFQDREYAKGQLWLSGVVLIILVTFLELAGILRPIRQAGEALSTPFLKVGASITYVLSTPYRVVTNNFHSYERIKDLELRYDQASAQLGEIDSLRAENEELRTLLNSQNSKEKASTTQQAVAAILSYGQPQIERSNKDIVNEGALLMIGDTIIGKVGQVGDGYAEALLLNQPTGATFLVKTQSGVSGIAQGNGREVVVTQLPIQSEIKEGERVVTVGQIGVPADLYIGQVQRVEKNSGETTQKAFLTQGVNFYESRFVQVRKTQ